MDNQKEVETKLEDIKTNTDRQAIKQRIKEKRKIIKAEIKEMKQEQKKAKKEEKMAVMQEKELAKKQKEMSQSNATDSIAHAAKQTSVVKTAEKSNGVVELIADKKNDGDSKFDWNAKFKEYLEDVVEIIKSNPMVSAVVCGFVLLVIVGAVFLTNKGENSEVDAVIAEVGEAIESAESEEEEAEEILVVLEQDAYPEINELINQYYQAMADGDMDVISEIRTITDTTESIKIEKRSQYIESYPTIRVYTKVGPEEDSFVVYAYYDVKFIDFETTTPGLNTWYVSKDSSGNYKITDSDMEDSIVEYINTVSAQNDVIDLFNEVQVAYNEILADNEALSNYLQDLQNLLTEAVGEALVSLESADDTETEETEETEEATEETVVVTKVRATDVVNIRISDSQESDKVGQAQIGDTFDLVEHKANGWSQIEFEDGYAYILREYLEDIETEVVSTDTGEEETEEAEEQQEEDGDTTVTDTIRVEDTINIRASASTNADKLGVVYPGEYLDIIVEQSDGWTKVLYNGRVGYVKSDLLN